MTRKSVDAMKDSKISWIWERATIARFLEENAILIRILKFEKNHFRTILSTIPVVKKFLFRKIMILGITVFM